MSRSSLFARLFIVMRRPARPEQRLRLIFACCDPALDSEEQVALMLHRVFALTTEQIARAFLVPTTTMARRLAGARARTPRDATKLEARDRLAQVMAALYLLFNEGFSVGDGALATEAIDLVRLLRDELRDCPHELEALLALMLPHDSRRDARVDGDGHLGPLPAQDRTRWNRARIAQG